MSSLSLVVQGLEDSCIKSRQSGGVRIQMNSSNFTVGFSRVKLRRNLRPLAHWDTLGHPGTHRKKVTDIPP